MERSLDDVPASIANREYSTAFRPGLSTHSLAPVPVEFMIICSYFSRNSRNNSICLCLSFSRRLLLWPGVADVSEEDVESVYNAVISTM